MTRSDLRQVIGSRIISNATPALEIAVNESFTYVGTLAFPLKDLAFVERVIFTQGTPQQIDRLFIVQFEGALTGADVSYRIPMQNPIVLGEREYHHNVWIYSHRENVESNPGAESEQTDRFLSERGLHLGDHLAMSRFARVVDSDCRHEIILFYLEAERIFGLSPAQYEAQPDDARAITDRMLLERSLQVFDVIDHSSA